MVIIEWAPNRVNELPIDLDKCANVYKSQFYSHRDCTFNFET